MEKWRPILVQQNSMKMLENHVRDELTLLTRSLLCAIKKFFQYVSIITNTDSQCYFPPLFTSEDLDGLLVATISFLAQNRICNTRNYLWHSYWFLVRLIEWGKWIELKESDKALTCPIGFVLMQLGFISIMCWSGFQTFIIVVIKHAV